MTRLFVLACIMMTCVGCGVRQPITHYRGTTITQSTPEAIAMDVEFEISNTNAIPLQLMKYNYAVSSGGQTVYVGFASAEKTVPHSSSIMSSVPVVIPRSVVFGKDSVSWKLVGTLGYIPPRAMSETLFETGIWKPSTSIRAHGLIEVPAITN